MFAHKCLFRYNISELSACIGLEIFWETACRSLHWQSSAQIKKIEFIKASYFSLVTLKVYLHIKSGSLRNLYRIEREKYQCQESVVAFLYFFIRKTETGFYFFFYFLFFLGPGRHGGVCMCIPPIISVKCISSFIVR